MPDSDDSPARRSTPASRSSATGAARCSPASVASSTAPIPRWSRSGNGAACRSGRMPAILCTGETYKAVVKLTFAKGAALPDPTGLFNASLGGNTRRAIDIHEGDAIDEDALTALIRAAAALNAAKPRARRSPG